MSLICKILTNVCFIWVVGEEDVKVWLGWRVWYGICGSSRFRIQILLVNQNHHLHYQFREPGTQFKRSLFRK